MTFSIVLMQVSEAKTCADTWTFESPFGLNWKGIGHWYISTEQHLSGNCCLTSGNVEKGESKNLSINVTGPADIQFYWMKSPVSMGYTKFYFYSDNQILFECKNTKWKTKEPVNFSILDNKTHTIRWEFGTFDSPQIHGTEDMAGYIDNLTISKKCPQLPQLPEGKEEKFFKIVNPTGGLSNHDGSNWLGILCGNWCGESKSNYEGNIISLYSSDFVKGNHIASGIIYGEFIYDKRNMMNKICFDGYIKGKLSCFTIPIASLVDKGLGWILNMPQILISKVNLYLILYDKTNNRNVVIPLLLYNKEIIPNVFGEISIDERLEGNIQSQLIQGHVYQIKLKAETITEAQGAVRATANLFRSSQDYFGIYWFNCTVESIEN